MAKPKRKSRRNQGGLGEFPVGEYVPVEAIKVNEDGTLNVVMKDSEMGPLVAQNCKRNPRKKTKAKKTKARRR